MARHIHGQLYSERTGARGGPLLFSIRHPTITAYKCIKRRIYLHSIAALRSFLRNMAIRRRCKRANCLLSEPRSNIPSLVARTRGYRANRVPAHG